MLGARGIQAVRIGGDRAVRAEGRDWPPRAETMIGLRRLDNLQRCAETVIREGVPGDFIETGVWRGGAAIFMRAVLAARGVRDRTVWVADSFQGLPRPNPSAYPADAGLDLFRHPELSVSLDQVKANFARYRLLDERVQFLAGWFEDTLPRAPIERLALLRLDGDLYESTMDALTALYPRLSTGGFVIVDDYDIAACARAVRDYREANGIRDQIEKIADTEYGVFWRRR
jgi:O-methyltransferase